MENTQLTVSSLRPQKGSRKKRKRLGIGEGSGNGKTCGKGQKGQTSRSGARIPRGFEGGQMPIHRRMPKVGFTSRKRVAGDNVFSVISTRKIEQLVADGKLKAEAVTLEALRAIGMAPSGRKSRVKILGGTPVAKKLVIQANAFSESAKIAIEAAGGTATVV
jgi:large subunit ribosomal protein L15